MNPRGESAQNEVYSQKTLSRKPFQQLPQKVGGVLVTRHAGRDAVSVGDVVGELDLEAVVVEAAGVLLGHAGELEIVGGDNARDGQRTDGLQKQAGAVELVQGVGAFQNLVEDDEGVG